jgi:hypothetical protein
LFPGGNGLFPGGNGLFPGGNALLTLFPLVYLGALEPVRCG